MAVRGAGVPAAEPELNGEGDDERRARRDETLAIGHAAMRDVPVIARMIDAAYRKYVDRIGRMPAPMTADLGGLVDARSLYVLRSDGGIVGSVVLSRKPDSIEIDDLAVAPCFQGRGYGGMLIAHAETVARAHGLEAVTLFTNEKMHENILFYGRHGFQEGGRRTENGFNRVFFRKGLP